MILFTSASLGLLIYVIASNKQRVDSNERRMNVVIGKLKELRRLLKEGV